MPRCRAQAALLTVALFLHACAAGPDAGQVAGGIRATVNSPRRSATTVASERLLEPRAVARFYAARRHRPAWQGEASERIVRAIRDIERDGLTPADYHLDAIERLRGGEGGDDPARRAADLDILLTDAVAGMIDHLRYGRVPPRALNPSWNVDPREDAPPLDSLVAQVVRAGRIDDAIAKQRPDHFIYRGLVEALAGLRAIRADGGWRAVPDGRPLRPGMSDARVAAIRARLRASGELPRGADTTSTRYDDALRQAVERFQARHRLEPDGVVDRNTIAAMNVPVDTRIAQVRANLERARWVLGGLTDDFVLVNLPAFKAYLIRNGRNVWETRTQIGEEAWQTPTFRATMQTIVLNPDWTVPPRILAEEVIAGMRTNPGYLSEKGLVVVNAENQEVDPSSIDWRGASPETFSFTVRQPPGEDNALGKVKFLFPNRHSIYLHDTPSQALFEAEKRMFSHGCIRIERALELAEILLGEKGWSPAKIQEVLATGETRHVAIEGKLPVLIVYWTVSVGASGETRFMQDVYDLDGPLVRSLDGGSARRSRTAAAARPRDSSSRARSLRALPRVPDGPGSASADRG